jgi:RHS repeat-associated protein
MVSSNTGTALTSGLISLGGSTSSGIGGQGGPDNPIGYCGYVFNTETRLYTVRFRHYWPALGTWQARDPLDYVDGGNLYEYCRGMPAVAVDPFGQRSWLGRLVFGGGASDDANEDAHKGGCDAIRAKLCNGGLDPKHVAHYQQMLKEWNCGETAGHEIGRAYSQGFGEGWSAGSYGIVGAFTGGLIDEDYGFFGQNRRVVDGVGLDSDYYTYGTWGGRGYVFFIVAYAYLAPGAEPGAAEGGNCFAAGTKVGTPAGDRNIEDINPGDKVYAYDFRNDCVVEDTVEAVHHNVTYRWVDIEIDGEVIRATRSHLFWSETDQAWCKAADLRPGVEVRLQSGEVATVCSLKIEELTKPEDTYNFEVRHQHNYFVGKAGMLVHNGPNFIVTPRGKVFPLPANAVPGPLDSGKPGISWKGGPGGNGLDEDVVEFSIRDPNWNQGTRASYYNAYGQKIDPYTGRTLSNADPMAHMACD